MAARTIENLHGSSKLYAKEEGESHIEEKFADDDREEF